MQNTKSSNPNVQKFSFRWNRPLKDQQNEAEVTDIVALSSHKTHSTPVDPIELKKRLVDLLIQRTTKGDQQALKLKVGIGITMPKALFFGNV